MTPIENAGSSPKWYSIKDAAEYLDIGEPTLYRWMRDGKITYRKVGDSTRFWKEDLDAVMEVHHSDREIDRVKATCPACHHDELVEGRLQSTGLNYFRPKKTKFWTLKLPDIGTEARMCPRCGFILLFGDHIKLGAVREEIALAATSAISAETGPSKPESLPQAGGTD
jgi:excisionase family DNA binding protein